MPVWLRGRRVALVVGMVALLALLAPLVLAQDQLDQPTPPPRDYLASGIQPEDVATPAAQSGCDGDAPYAEVQIDTHPRVALELATTEAEREQGLMYRQTLDPDSGMLFVYTQPVTEAYWMHNTLVPLSIAWLGKDGTIVDIQDMQPETDNAHAPSMAYWYALEVNQGWFADHGVGVGQQIQLCVAPAPAS
jgi:uncharacterized membrane protein (UPF0127 family)